MASRIPVKTFSETCHLPRIQKFQQFHPYKTVSQTNTPKGTEKRRPEKRGKTPLKP